MLLLWVFLSEGVCFSWTRLPTKARVTDDGNLVGRRLRRRHTGVVPHERHISSCCVSSSRPLWCATNCSQSHAPTFVHFSFVVYHSSHSHGLSHGLSHVSARRCLCLAREKSRRTAPNSCQECEHHVTVFSRVDTQHELALLLRRGSPVPKTEMLPLSHEDCGRSDAGSAPRVLSEMLPIDVLPIRYSMIIAVVFLNGAVCAAACPSSCK